MPEHHQTEDNKPKTYIENVLAPLEARRAAQLKAEEVAKTVKPEAKKSNSLYGGKVEMQDGFPAFMADNEPVADTDIVEADVEVEEPLALETDYESGPATTLDHSNLTLDDEWPDLPPLESADEQSPRARQFDMPPQPKPSNIFEPSKQSQLWTQPHRKSDLHKADEE